MRGSCTALPCGSRGYKQIRETQAKARIVRLLAHSPFIDEIKNLRLLRWELGEGAAPLHQAARRVVLHVRLEVNFLHGGGTGGGAKQSAEAAGDVTEKPRGNQPIGGRGKSKAGSQPDNHQHVNNEQACWKQNDNSGPL